MIGSIEIIGLLSGKAGFDGSLWTWFQAIDIDTLGFIIVGMFVLTWAVALSVWHFGKIEERWTAQIKETKVD